MRGKITVAVLGVAAVAILIFLLPRRPTRGGVAAGPEERVVSIAAPTAAVNGQPSQPNGAPSVPPSAIATASAVIHQPLSPSAPAHPLQFTNIAPEAALDHLRNVFHQYASMFGGNPVGTNPEITAALHGGNPKGADFIDPEAGMRIDAQGDLIDPWGTPYFFHQLSGQEMEIHCAGPDRKMWTADDLVVK